MATKKMTDIGDPVDIESIMTHIARKEEQELRRKMRELESEIKTTAPSVSAAPSWVETTISWLIQNGHLHPTIRMTSSKEVLINALDKFRYGFFDSLKAYKAFRKPLEVKLQDFENIYQAWLVSSVESWTHADHQNLIRHLHSPAAGKAPSASDHEEKLTMTSEDGTELTESIRIMESGGVSKTVRKVASQDIDDVIEAESIAKDPRSGAW